MNNSLSDVQQFCFKLTAELDMGYESPPLPVQMLPGRISSGQASSPVNGPEQNCVKLLHVEKDGAADQEHDEHQHHTPSEFVEVSEQELSVLVA